MPRRCSVLSQRRSGRGCNTVHPRCTVDGSHHRHPVVFRLGTHGTRPSPAAAPMGTKRGDPLPPSWQSYIPHSFAGQVLWESSCSCPALLPARASTQNQGTPHPNCSKARKRGQKTTPRIPSHPLRSEASWHGPSRGERREFLLQKNDLTLPP